MGCLHPVIGSPREMPSCRGGDSGQRHHPGQPEISRSAVVGGCGGGPLARLFPERRQHSQEVLVRNRLLLTAAIVLAASGAATGATAASSAAAASGPCGTATTPPAYHHVIWIWMENHSFGDIIGNKSQAPYINSLAASCGLATGYHNTTHPSLPNYLAATSGLAQAQLPILSFTDCNVSSFCDTSAPSIFGQGETWKAYQESMPSNCDRSDAGEYAVRHNPPPYYTSLAGCASHDVPYTQLATDLAGNTLPAFSFVTPNLIDDMHDGTITQGDTWLSKNLPAILNSEPYRARTTAVFITWDEGSGGYPVEDCDDPSTTDSSCRVPTIVISPSTPAGITSATFFSHYSLLATTEQLLGLPKLGQAGSASTMTAAFHL
jgi:phosphatidylinositol-3-phosphatase